MYENKSIFRQNCSIHLTSTIILQSILVLAMFFYSSMVFASSAINSSDSCRYTAFGKFKALSSAGVSLHFELKRDAVRIKSKMVDRVLSVENAYQIAGFSQNSSVYSDIDDIFSAIFPKQVSNIDKSDCAIYYKSDLHEIYVVNIREPSKGLMVLEYSNADPPEVYLLIP